MGATASMVRWPGTLCRQLAGSGLYVIRYDNRDTGISTSYTPYAPPYTAVDLAEDAVGILMELIELLAKVDWHIPAAAVEAWVIEDRMLHGTYPFDQPWRLRLLI